MLDRLRREATSAERLTHRADVFSPDSAIKMPARPSFIYYIHLYSP